MIPDQFAKVWVQVVMLGDQPNLVIQTGRDSLTRLEWWQPAGDDWDVVSVDAFDGGSHGMSAAASGSEPLIAYYESASIGVDGLVIAQREGDGTWSTQRILDGDFTGRDVRLAIEPGGTPHVVYRQIDEPSLWHASPGDDGVDQNCDGAG